MKALWKNYPKRVKFILAVAVALGFCLSVILAAWNDVHPLWEFVTWVLVGTPVLGIAALLAANTLAVICIASADSPPGFGSCRSDEIAVNPSTGLMMVDGSIDTGGNPLGGQWPH